MRLIQNKSGFCFGVDAVLLASFADIREGDTVLDMCTGTGIVPVLLAAKTSAAEITGIEIMPGAAELAGRNVLLNSLGHVKIIEGDVREAAKILKKDYFNHITCNPPYKKAGSGLINPGDEKAAARHEILCTLEDIISQSAALLKYGGRLSMVHRPDRLCDIMYLMRKHKIEPKRLRLVHPREGENANLVLIEGALGGGVFLKTLPPLYVYKNGEYSDELNKLYGRDEQVER